MDRRGFVILGLGFGATSLQTRAAAPNVMRLVYYEAAEPLSWRNDQGVMAGALVEILDECLHKRVKIPLSHEGYPWARAQSMVKNKIADAFCTIATAERLTYTVASTEPVIRVPVVIYAKKNTPRLAELMNVKTVEDLRQFSHVSYLGNGWVKEHMGNMAILYEAKKEDCLRHLLLGTADVFIDSRPSTSRYIEKMGLKEQIIELPVPIDYVNYHLCVGKESRFVTMLPEFDNALRSMKKGPRWREIVEQYRVS